MKIEQSFKRIAEIDEFRDKYQELIKSLIDFRKSADSNGFIISEVTLQPFWNRKFPELEKDMQKMDFPTLLGVKLLPPYTNNIQL